MKIFLYIALFLFSFNLFAETYNVELECDPMIGAEVDYQGKVQDDKRSNKTIIKINGNDEEGYITMGSDSEVMKIIAAGNSSNKIIKEGNEFIQNDTLTAFYSNGYMEEIITIIFGDKDSSKIFYTKHVHFILNNKYIGGGETLSSKCKIIKL